METLYQVLGAAGLALIMWVTYRFIKARPESLSGENLSKSFYTMGLLALLLIAIVTFLVFLMRQ